MSKPSPKEIKIREYEDQRDLATRADAVLKAASVLVEQELGSEIDGVTFMPALNVVCRLKSDPSTAVDPVSFSVVKRPTSKHQINDIVHNILLKDPIFLSSIMHGVAEHLAEMMSIHFDMTSLVNSMGEGFNEETEVETDENKGKDSESQSNDGIQGLKKNSNEVN